MRNQNHHFLSPTAEDMLSHARSEIFYWIGLLCTARWQHDKASTSYQLSGDLDLALHWPAFFAKKA